MRRVLIGLLWAVPAYFAGAIGGGYLVYLMSTNRHDRAMEAEMTGAFFLGPAVALVGFLGGAIAPKVRPEDDRGGRPGPGSPRELRARWPQNPEKRAANGVQP